MSTREQYAVCLRLVKALSERNSWCGETHIQKSLYVMQTLMAGKPVWDFILYKHGPYSFALHATIDELRQMEFLLFIVQPPYGPKIRLSQHGETLLEKLSANAREYTDAIEKTADLLADKRVQQLEKIGTALLLKQKYGDDEEELAKKLHDVKPHIAIDEAKQAVRECQQVSRAFAEC